MSGSGTQHTTLPLSTRVVHPSSDTEQLRLLWLFPRPSDPTIELSELPDEELVVGRDEDCNVRLVGPDISRRHASIRYQDSEYWVTDLGSRNGTFINGYRNTSARIGLNDVVRFGAHVALVTDRAGTTVEVGPGLIAGPHLRAELDPVMQAATSDLPVILEGETGTGKEVVARAIHAWSCRKGPFVAVNCAALPESLAEGELFGYRRGAFTGADRANTGFFRAASGGTLLLDEVSDLPLAIQAKLLRVLEQREVQPLGESQPIGVDVRVIVATQEPLLDAVHQKRFRQDLLARLDGINVRLPPLRRRLEDVLPLLSRVLGQLSAGQSPSFDAELVERLCLYDWPFNVREVVLLAKRLWVLHGKEPCLGVRHLPSRIADAHHLQTAGKTEAAPTNESNEPIQFPALIAALRASHGNVAQAAAMLSITRQRAYRLMQGQAVDLEVLRGSDKARL
jgi:transcriptional regulator of acetoin/glycerol metabolism